MDRENNAHLDWDYTRQQILLPKDGILCKTESWYKSDPYNITLVHKNGTIRVQHGTKSERLNITRVTPYFE